MSANDDSTNNGITYSPPVYTTDNTYTITSSDANDWTYYPSTSAYSSVPTRKIIALPGYTGDNLYTNSDVACAKCKETKPISDIAVSYGYLKIARHICSKCEIKRLDQYYGVEADPDLEEALFKK